MVPPAVGPEPLSSSPADLGSASAGGGPRRELGGGRCYDRHPSEAQLSSRRGRVKAPARFVGGGRSDSEQYRDQPRRRRCHEFAVDDDAVALPVDEVVELERHPVEDLATKRYLRVTAA